MLGKKINLKSGYAHSNGIVYRNLLGDEFSKYVLHGLAFSNEHREKYMHDLNSSIIKTKYQISDSCVFSSLIDSINIKDLNKEKDFKIVDEGKEYEILGYKIVADNVDYEITYVNQQYEGVNENYMMFDSNFTYAKDWLLSSLKELERCSRIVLTDFYYYSKKDKQKYNLSLDILLKN